MASPKGRWPKLDPFKGDGIGRNVNWTTPDALADMAGQSTFHSNRVWIMAKVMVLPFAVDPSPP